MKLGRVPSVAMALSVLVVGAWVAIHAASDTPVDQRERTTPVTALASFTAESPAHARLHARLERASGRNPFATASASIEHTKPQRAPAPSSASPEPGDAAHTHEEASTAGARADATEAGTASSAPVACANT